MQCRDFIEPLWSTWFAIPVCHPSWTSYIVALCWLWAFFFFLGFISRPHCVGLLWDHDAYVAAVAIAVRLRPRPTIRVLWAVETQAVTELGYTAPSLLGWGVLGPKRIRLWKCAITIHATKSPQSLVPSLARVASSSTPLVTVTHERKPRSVRLTRAKMEEIWFLFTCFCVLFFV